MRFTLPRAARVSVLLAIAAFVAVPLAVAGAANEVTPLSPQPSAETGRVTLEVPNAWFVEFQGRPLAAGGNAGALRSEKQAFRNAARSEGIAFRERFAFDTLWNGLSIEVGTANAGKLPGISGVKAIYPVQSIPIPETTGANPELATAIVMTGADIAQNELGLTGEGVKVAVMDTGIDYDHADLGGDGTTRTDSTAFPTPRVTHGWDFVGDDYNANPASPAYSPTPVPDPRPDDCNGHGTHVAGIVGANGDVVGVAPGVTYGAYRVFGCTGSTTEDIMIAAMERAYADGMHVLNMSIGDAFNSWPQTPTAAASDTLVDRGVVVVASIGNSGANGVYSAGAPGVGTKVMGVASYDNSHVELATFTVTPANITAGYGNAAAAPPAPTEGSLPLSKTGTPTSAADACAPADLGDLTGQAVLIRRGTCTFYEKSRRAQLAGAAAVVLYNNCPPNCGRFSPTVAVAAGAADEQPVTIPVVAISDEEGVAINDAIESEPQTLNWTDETGTFENPTGGLISSFSSYGLNAVLDVKPDIGAPGGLIRSTYPLEAGAYATVSGTSMSSPHTAGAAALFLEAHPGTAPLTVRSVLQNSAEPKNWQGNPGLGFLDQVHRQGAGMLDIPGAILATTRITPAKIALGESETLSAQTRTLTLQNSASSPVTYDLSFVNALSTGGSTFAPGAFLGNASVAFSAPSVTVPAGGSTSVNATITPAASPALGQYGGYIVFTPQGGGDVLRVPYAGFVGDYQAIEVLTPSSFGSPRVARLVDCNPVLVRGLDCFDPAGTYADGGGQTFTMTDAFNVPQVQIHRAHQARRMEIEILTAAGQKVHPVFSNMLELEFLSRSSTSTSFFAYPWDGTRMHSAGNSGLRKAVPNGRYKLVVKVLKALGNPNNPAHWETKETATFTIARP